MKMEQLSGKWQVASGKWWRVVRLFVFLLATYHLSLATGLFGQAKTTVTDTLFNADGSKPSGTLVATNLSAFTSADGFVIAAGSKVNAAITNGLFTISLVPNAGSNPAGTSYAVNYYLPGLSMTETWVVPSSVPAVNLAAVRVLSPPLPTVMLAMSQINPPSPCTANFFAQWSGIQWQCAAGGGGGGATFQVNGTNTTSQTTLNWQTGTNITVSNPSAGNVVFNFSGTLPVASGGTGQTAASAAFNALSPMTTLGDLIYGGSAPAGAGTRLAGNTTSTKQYLTQTGTGAASSAPTWAQGAFADLSGTASDSQLANAYSGVGSCAANQWINALTRNAAPTCAQPGFSNLSGSATKGQLPGTTVYTDQANTFGAFLQKFQAGTNFNFSDPTDTTKLAKLDLSNLTTATTRTVNVPDANSTLAQSFTAAANQFLTAMSAQGVFSAVQPGFSNLSGSIALGQTPLTTQGDLLFANATPALARLGIGTNGQCLTSNGTTVSWGACAAGSGVTLQTNTVNNASQTALNLTNSAATNGITLTHTNTSGGIVQLGLSGTLTVPGGGTALTTITANQLIAGRGTAAPVSIASGTAGQALLSNGAGADPSFQDPIVSYAFVNLFNAASATATATSSTVRVPTFGGYGTLYVTYASITGSPAGCTLQLKAADSLGNLTNSGAAFSTTPANGTTTAAVNDGSVRPLTTAQMQAVYSCTTFPTAGTISLDYVPGIGVNLLAALPVGANTIGAVTQASGPWTSNVTQFGGTNIATGTGAGGLGIPRVTVSNDSNVLATQSGTWTVQPGNTANTTAWLVTGAGGTFPATESGTWTVQPGNTQNTTPWLTQDAANGTVAAGTAAGKAELIGCQFNTTLPTLTTGQQAAAQCDSSARPLIGSIAAALPTGTNSLGTVGLNTGANVIGALSANQSTNVAQFGGTNVATGTGASGAGIPRVTISNDSSLAANQSVNEAQIGGSAVVADPCQQFARTHFNINQAAGAQLITGVASKQTYICDLDLITATAQNVALVEGTGTVCATGTAGMDGGATAATGWNLAANGGLVKGTGQAWVFRTAAAADNVCLLQSGTGQTSGGGDYVQN